MRLEVVVGKVTRALNLADRPVTVGGATDDDVRVEGLPPGAFRFEVRAGRLTVRGRRPCTLGQRALAPEVLHLLPAGEWVGCGSAVRVRALDEEPAQTACLVKELLGDAEEPTIQGPSLVCLSGADRGKRFALALPRMVLGRGDDCHVRVRDRTTSRQHARVTRTAFGVQVEDLGAPNGTWVNSRKLNRRAAPLKDGDLLKLGSALLQFSLPAQRPRPLAPRRAPPSNLRGWAVAMAGATVVGCLGGWWLLP